MPPDEQRGVFDNETIIHQQQLLETYRRNLRHLLVQAAQYGGEASAPLDVSNNSHRARAHIRQTKTTLRASGVEVADHPNDEPDIIAPEGISPEIVQRDRVRTAELRELLKSAFCDEELTIFCYDYFSPVYEMFSSGMGRLVKIQLLIEYCEKQGKFKELLRLLEHKNPHQYNAFFSGAQKAQEHPPEPKKISTSIRTEVQIVLNGDLHGFTPELQGAAIRALAAVLNISPEQVKLLSVSSGSIILKVEIDKETSERLLQLYEAQDPAIQDLGIQEVTIPTKHIDKDRQALIKYATIFASIPVTPFAFAISAIIVGKIVFSIETGITAYVTTLALVIALCVLTMIGIHRLFDYLIDRIISRRGCRTGLIVYGVILLMIGILPLLVAYIQSLFK